MQRRTLFSLLVVGLPLGEPPTLREGDRLLIDTVQLLGTIAGELDKYSVIRKYLVQREVVTKFIETQYAGWSVDWGVLPAVLRAKSP